MQAADASHRRWVVLVGRRPDVQGTTKHRDQDHVHNVAVRERDVFGSSRERELVRPSGTRVTPLPAVQ